MEERVRFSDVLVIGGFDMDITASIERDPNLIRLSAKSGRIFDEFKREVLKLPNVLECHLVSGDFDYLIKARIPEMNAYRRLLGDMLLALPGARESRSYVVMEEVKESLSLTIED
jgi:Lrp/AsnC family leucine-responsive transcriptional regulator